MNLDLVSILSDLVAIPSVNPMGRPVGGPEFYEYRLTDYLERLFQRLGWPAQRQTIEPRRDNILARLDGGTAPEQGGPLLLYEVHQDTVPVDGMTIEPWNPVVRDGRVYGRGACDIKGGMAAMLVALARLAELPASDRPTVVLACTINEEHGYTGAKGIVRLWQSGECALLPRRPDVAIVAEPTLLDVVVAHKGMIRWHIQTRGRAAHSSQPERGENAIFRMAQVLTALEEYQQRIVTTLARHPRCGVSTLSVGVIAGGVSVNTVPDRCTIEVDRRLVPGENPHEARQHVIDYLTARLGEDFPLEHIAAGLGSGGLSDEHNLPLAEELARVAQGVAGSSQLIGVPYGTDACIYSAAGIPTVVFGPGSIAQAHTADEWVEISQLEKASEIYFRFARDYRPLPRGR